MLFLQLLNERQILLLGVSMGTAHCPGRQFMLHASNIYFNFAWREKGDKLALPLRCGPGIPGSLQQNVTCCFFLKARCTEGEVLFCVLLVLYQLSPGLCLTLYSSVLLFTCVRTLSIKSKMHKAKMCWATKSVAWHAEHSLGD